jgi:hypothetical protein
MEGKREAKHKIKGEDEVELYQPGLLFTKTFDEV